MNAPPTPPPPQAARLPAGLALGPVRLRVADLARSADWLARVTGLQPLGPTTWGVPPATPLVELREVPQARPVPRQGRLGLYHYAVLLPTRADLGRFLSHLEALDEPWGASDHLVSEAIYLTDPDGLTVEVYADRPTEAWPRAGGELRMALDPLDRDGLVAAVGATRWEGAPAGTRMGHVHLFVDDLHAAERHYVRGVGFEVVTRRLPGALFVAAGGYHHHLGLNTWAAGEPVAGEHDAGLDEWSLELPTAAALGELEARLGAAGIAAGREPGGVRLSDPWGVGLRVTWRAPAPGRP